MKTFGAVGSEAKIHPCSRCTTPIRPFYNDADFETVATGFFYHHENQFYLVSNWHVFSGRRADNKQPLRVKDGAIPNNIEIIFSLSDGSGNMVSTRVPLESQSSAHWLQHRTLGSAADVAVLPLAPDSQFKIHPLNDEEAPFPEGMGAAIGKEVFVLGYPLGNLVIHGTPFPVWKRASIATEPDYNFENFPLFLVDTATRAGMSGAPVVLMKGEFLEFLGTYSGRYGANDLGEVQLGRVWRKHVLEEIIADGVPGIRSCELP